MSQIKMVIDLSLCVGCGTCGIACKAGNNTSKRAKKQTHTFCDVVTVTSGSLPGSAKWTAYSTMCNHCDNPRCMQVCPVAAVSDSNCVNNKRKAMYKLTAAKGGLVLHDPSRCIGCGRCQSHCPYSSADINYYGAKFSVISKNQTTTYWTSDAEAVLECTGSPLQVVAATGQTPPNKTVWTSALAGTLSTLPAINDMSTARKVDKCKLCAHRLLASNGALLPYCVQACTANARKLVGVTGNISDDAGNAYDGAADTSKTLAAVPAGAKVLKHGAPTATGELLIDPYTSGNSRPNVLYINSFSKR